MPQFEGDEIKNKTIDDAIVSPVKPTTQVDIEAMTAEAAHTGPTHFAKPTQVVVDGKTLAPREMLRDDNTKGRSAA